MFDDNNANVCDYEGNAIICVGSWNAPDNIRQFGSALTLVHVSRGQSDSYSEACPDCVSGRAQVSEGRSFFGCEAHYPNRKICRTGDRMADKKLNDYIKSVFF